MILKKIPTSAGQLIWCPSDPALGIGVVLACDAMRLRVRFLRLQEERLYSLRSVQPPILRYEIAHGEQVQDSAGGTYKVERLVAALDDAGKQIALWQYVLDDGREVAESELIPHVRDVGAKERLAHLNLVHPEVIRTRLKGLHLAHFGARPGYAAIIGARVAHLPHQIDVATRAIAQNPVRLLLADEVGLGKTVESALIYAGLRHEGRAARVLVLTPESLCLQWLGEMYRKVHELFVLLDEERLGDTQRDFPDLNPFEAHQRLVTSLDVLVADPSLAEQAADAAWDVLIVDEAHHLRLGSTAYEVVQQLAAKSQHVLLLTATPMALDPNEYHALLRLLDMHRFDDPVLFGDIADRSTRIRHMACALVEVTGQKQVLPAALAQELQVVLQDDPVDAAQLTKFVACKPQMHKKRHLLLQDILAALRARHGLTDYVIRNRRGPVGGLKARCADVFPIEATSLQATLLDIGESVMLDFAATIDDVAIRNRVTGELLRALWATPRALTDILRPYSKQLVQELAPYIAQVIDAPIDNQGLPTGDARLRWLLQQIKHAAGEKILVFVESAVAVSALRDSLAPFLNNHIAVFHRGLTPRDQDRQVAYFRDPAGPAVMLSTEAGGEGRNFQFCHHVVLYDLPWRPATIEQRIGRVDRVGQQHDVRVWVPYFKSSYEAAIVKIMHQSIGVLSHTVGGIDHALEYVADNLAELILNSADANAWKDLYKQTEILIQEARHHMDVEVDPILDHSSFSKERAAAVLSCVPENLESQIESFIHGYAAHNKLDMQARGPHVWAIHGAPSAIGGDSDETEYVATFSRTYALDHEEVQFLSFGHPLVEAALEWAKHSHATSASLALFRSAPQEGAAFMWSFGLDLPADVAEASTYFDKRLFVLTLDESQTLREDLQALCEPPDVVLDRMDAQLLRQHLPRWQALVHTNHTAAEQMAIAQVKQSIATALQRFEQVAETQARYMHRSHHRALALFADTQVPATLIAEQTAQQEALQQHLQRVRLAITKATPHLISATAVRFVRPKHVSA